MFIPRNGRSKLSSRLAGIIIPDPLADLFFGFPVGDLRAPAQLRARQGGVYVIVPSHHGNRQARQLWTDVQRVEYKIIHCSNRPRNPEGNAAEGTLADKGKYFDIAKYT